MSYRALLFCPDETVARLVKQVLSELDFTVELSFEPFVTVQKLSAEPFDAVVVDCVNEENASLLFKGARNSSLNHSSLCVAVVEGQMGVAKAFRIGANLVLTKPINIEQSKGTLRVARGLLRKTDSKPVATPTVTAKTSPLPVPAPSSSSAAQAAPVVASTMATAASSDQAAPARAAAAPTSLFEAEQDKTPHRAGDDKPGESMPDFLIQKPAPVEQTSAPVPLSLSRKFAGPVASSAAAAPARAPIPTKSSAISMQPAEPQVPAGRQIKTAAPLATQETIIADRHHPEPSPAYVPTFSSYAQHPVAASGAGTKILWTLVCLLILAPASYVGWQKLQPMRYIHRPDPGTDTDTTSAPPQPTAETNSLPVSAPPAEQQTGTSPAPSADPATSSNTSDSANAAPEGFPTKETIEVGQPLDEPDPNIDVVAKQPLHVNQKAARAKEPAPTPPSLEIEAKAADTALAGIISTNVAVPKPAPGALQVSEGVTQGLLIKKIAPIYPATALQLRKQGTVELLATVSKTGAITKVKVLSGESALAKAAVDAVRQWKYRPFLLNSEPVEIQTQITINFRLPK
jgi:TonB family protein